MTAHFFQTFLTENTATVGALTNIRLILIFSQCDRYDFSISLVCTPALYKCSWVVNKNMQRNDLLFSHATQSNLFCVEKMKCYVGLTINCDVAGEKKNESKVAMSSY